MERKAATMCPERSVLMRPINSVPSKTRKGTTEPIKDNMIADDISLTYNGFLYQNTSSQAACNDCPTAMDSVCEAEPTDAVYKLDDDGSMAESYVLAKRVKSATCFLPENTIVETDESCSSMGKMKEIATPSSCHTICDKSCDLYQGFRLAFVV